MQTNKAGEMSDCQKSVSLFVVCHNLIPALWVRRFSQLAVLHRGFLYDMGTAMSNYFVGKSI